MPDLAHTFPELHALHAELSRHLDQNLPPDLACEKAVQAWQSGLVDLTLMFCDRAAGQMDLLKAIALNRQGHPHAALEVLKGQEGALSLVHQGSSLWQLGELEEALDLTQQGLDQARKERNGTGIISAVCILGEVLLDLGQHKQAVVTLAEAFKVAEMMGQEADPYALAITAEAHTRWGHPRKAQATVEKVFSRTRPFEMAHVRAQISLGAIEPAALEQARRVVEALGWGFWQKRLQSRA
ncbi:tetratricopeptide repeat protein [Deinococcus cellulosilyticus]|nr:tetratricopeptide repeat protein [Deinococcus cellulosilyticus]